jgi:hypothetical protein
MDRIKNIFDKIGSLIPGYQGYAERDGRRNCDKILRDSIANQLIDCEKLLYSLMSNALKNKDKIKMGEIEELRKQTNTLMSKVKFAPYGVTAFFSDNQIKEDELFNIYQSDFELADNVSNLYILIQNEELKLIDLQIKKCFTNLNNRNNYINEFK